MSKTNVNTITTSDVLLHHKKRRYLNLVFTEKSVRTAGLFIQTHVDLWNKLLPDGEDWSQPKNVSDWIDYLVFDILCDLCFGRSLGTKNPGENPFKGIPKAIHTHMKFMYPVRSIDNSKFQAAVPSNTIKITHSPLLGFLLWSQSKGLNRLFEIIMPSDIRDYYRFVQDSVAARIKAEQASEQHDKDGKEMRQDMIHFLYHAIDPQTGRRAYSQQELFCEANLLVTAGSDTTAITLSGFFFYIVRNPGPYKKLVREIRSTFNSADEITGGCKLSSCKYLRACVDESLRITPAVPSELCRTILPGGQIIDNEFYPAGIVVSTSGYTTGRSDGYGDPNTFRPERWIVDEAAGRTADEVARISSYIRPFSAGWSNCVGQNLAMLELLITIARTLYRLDVRAAPGSTLGEGNPDLGWGRGEKDEFQLFDAFVAMRDGPMVQFKRREES